MSKLEQLIAELCPAGVEYVKLESILTIKNGKDYKHLATGSIPVYGSGGIMTYVDTCVYDKPSVLIPRKGSLDKLYYVDVPFWTVDTIFWTEIDTHQVDPKYVFYNLQSRHLEDLNMAGGVPSLTQAVLNKVAIPLPPLPVQREIVRILDNFTELTAELTTELTARRKQYEYYRNALLTFGDDVPMVPLGEIAEIGTGSSNTNEALTEGVYPFYVRSQEIRYKNTYEFDETAIITSGDGVGVGKIFHYVQGKYALHQRAYRIKITDKRINSKFYFYFMQSDFTKYMSMTAVHASVTSVRKPMLDKYPVPIPSLAEQARIVSILDKFDALTTDITSGLPAEIEARRKQYEYYRDKLLTFKEA